MVPCPSRHKVYSPDCLLLCRQTCVSLQYLSLQFHRSVSLRELFLMLFIFYSTVGCVGWRDSGEKGSLNVGKR